MSHSLLSYPNVTCSAAPSLPLPLHQDLCCEVAGRLSAAGARAKTLTLKVKRRQAGAPEPAKFLGHGACDNISRSVTLARYVGSAEELCREALGLLEALGVPVEELRGLGLTVSA